VLHFAFWIETTFFQHAVVAILQPTSTVRPSFIERIPARNQTAPAGKELAGKTKNCTLQ
jgi:hypothetical protein